MLYTLTQVVADDKIWCQHCANDKIWRQHCHKLSLRTLLTWKNVSRYFQCNSHIVYENHICFEYGKINIILILNEIFIMNIGFFPLYMDKNLSFEGFNIRLCLHNIFFVNTVYFYYQNKLLVYEDCYILITWFPFIVLYAVAFDRILPTLHDFLTDVICLYKNFNWNKRLSKLSVLAHKFIIFCSK